MTFGRDEHLQRLAALEKDIAAAVKRYGTGDIESIRLAQGAEEADVSCNVDLSVRSQGQGERVFTVLSLSGVNRLLGEEAAEDFYTAGGPLIIVGQMSADVIARGILKYLRMERVLER